MTRYIYVIAIVTLISYSLSAQDWDDPLLGSIDKYSWDRDAGEWIFSGHTFYSYNSDSRLELIEYFDENQMLYRLEEYLYGQNESDRIVRLVKVDSVFNYLKYNKIYDNDERSIESKTYKWIENEWDQRDRYYDYSYNESDQLLGFTRQLKDENMIFYDAFLSTYIYEDIYLTEYEMFDVINSAPRIKQLYYNDLNTGFRDSMVQFSWNTESWLKKSITLYTYSDCGSLETIILKVYDNGEPINKDKTIFNYDLISNPQAKKVPICHNGHTIYVSRNAVKSHLAHGDCLGKCISDRTPKKWEKSSTNKKSSKSGKLSSIIGASNNKILIYPNPAKDKFTIEFSDSSVTRVDLLNTTGALIESKTASGQNSVIFKRKNLSPGLYYVRVLSENPSTHMVSIQ